MSDEGDERDVVEQVGENPADNVVEEDNTVFFQIPPKPLFDPDDNSDWSKMVRKFRVANSDFNFCRFGNQNCVCFQVGYRISVRWGDHKRSK